jgi:hypothetical protein
MNTIVVTLPAGATLPEAAMPAPVVRRAVQAV